MVIPVDPNLRIDSRFKVDSGGGGTTGDVTVINGPTQPVPVYAPNPIPVESAQAPLTGVLDFELVAYNNQFPVVTVRKLVDDPYGAVAFYVKPVTSIPAVAINFVPDYEIWGNSIACRHGTSITSTAVTGSVPLPQIFNGSSWVSVAWPTAPGGIRRLYGYFFRTLRAVIETSGMSPVPDGSKIRLILLSTMPLEVV